MSIDNEKNSIEEKAITTTFNAAESIEYKAKLTGATLLPDRVLASKMVTNIVDTNYIVLGNRLFKRIVDDPKIEDPESVLSAFGIKKRLEPFEKIAQDLLDATEAFKNTNLISEPLVDPHFLDLHWDSKGVKFDFGNAIFLNTFTDPFDENSYLKIKSTAFLENGIHYVELFISELPSMSTIEVFDYEDKLIYTANTEGLHRFKIIVTNTTVGVLLLKAKNIPVDSNIRLESLYIYHVRIPLEKYLLYMQTQLDTGGFVTDTSLEQTLLKFNLSINTTLSAAIQNFRDTLQIHIDESNPHGTTFSDVGAAPLVHTHSPTDCGAAPLHHTHPASDLTLGNVDLDEFATHVQNTNNPHSVKKEQVGLGNLPNAISSNPADTGTDKLSTATATNKVVQQLALHTSERNPHGTTKFDIQLSNVENFFLGTSLEHVDGTSDRYASTEGVKYAVSQWSLQEAHIQQMQPKVNYFLEIYKDHPENIPLKKDRIYQIKIKPSSSSNIKNLKLNFNGVDSYNNTIQYYAPDSTDKWPTVNESASYMQLIPTVFGTGSYLGKLTLDTSTFTIESDGTYILTDSSNNLLSKPFIKLKGNHHIESYGTHIDEFLSSLENISTLSISSETDALDYFEVYVYEMYPVHTKPQVIVDAAPVGTMWSYLGTLPTNGGYSYMDGSEISRVNYQELFDFATDNNLIVSETEWHQTKEDNDDVPFFSGGDEISTFRLPYVSDIHAPFTLNLIKVKPVVLPDDTQVLYELFESTYNQNP